MCGRFTLDAQGKRIADQFRTVVRADLMPQYNIAPSQPVLIVRDTLAQREAVLVRWGLVPSWADNIDRLGKRFTAYWRCTRPAPFPSASAYRGQGNVHVSWSSLVEPAAGILSHTGDRG